MHRATTMPARKVAYHDEAETVQMRLYKSLKVWSMYADLEESFGTFKARFFVIQFKCYFYVIAYFFFTLHKVRFLILCFL